jgi:hypothetical protein
LAVAAAAVLAGASACKDREPPIATAEAIEVVDSAGRPEFIEWVVYENANSKLMEAERHLLEADSRMASAALDQVAANMARVAESSGDVDAARLRASAEELKALATDFPENLLAHRKVLGDVEGRALIALARHHLVTVERLAPLGDGALAGRHLMSAANDIAEGFRVANLALPAPSAAALDAARNTAEAWMAMEKPTTESTGVAVRQVREQAQRLANALGAMHT